MATYCVVYYIRDSDHPHCYDEERNFVGMNSFWEWVDNSAEYSHSVNVSKVLYDYWGADVSSPTMQWNLQIRDTLSHRVHCREVVLFLEVSKCIITMENRS